MSHPLGGSADTSKVRLPLDVELVCVVFEDGLAEPVDASKRGAEIVGDRLERDTAVAARADMRRASAWASVGEPLIASSMSWESCGSP